MNSQQQKWDQRYAGSNTPPSAAAVLTDNSHLLPPRGLALDLACGLGGNALWLAEREIRCEAWDLSPVAIAKLQAEANARNLPITARVEDLTRTPLPEARYDLICVSHFLDRALCPAIAKALRPGGLLFYQTFTREKVSEGGPSNPDFLLERGELLQLFSGLLPVAYREEGRRGDLACGLRNAAYLVAERPIVSSRRQETKCGLSDSSS